MAKFVKVAAKKTMLKVAVDGQEKWATCTPQVLGFAKNTFKGGEEVDIQSEASGEVGFHITRIEKSGDMAKKVQDKTPKSNKHTCSDCGAELKDTKYTKCWTCNQKNPAPKSGGSYGKSPEVQASIKRQAIMHAVSRALIALQGHLDPNNVNQVAESLYKKFQDLVG